jgi:tRNA (uracil-5-)-methyltransferase TRM9
MDSDLNEKEFEKEYVHKFYSKKSTPFSDSRVKPWPFTIEFMKTYSNDSSLVLDSGCGNGRQFMSQNTIGLDFSENLLREAQKKPNIGLIRGNIHALPFKDETFDIALSIAVIHHLSTEQRRREALLEMKRVMKSGAHGLIYVWHSEASKKAKFQKIKDNDFFVSWRGECDLMRYYCLFTEQTLRNLCVECGFEVLDVRREEESVYASVQKR